MENIQLILNFIFWKIDLIDFKLLISLLVDISIITLGIIVTVFVLTVTLLGRAARLAKEKRAETEQKSQQEFDNDISKLKEQTDAEVTPSDIYKLKKQIEELELKKAYTERKIKEIERKYSALGLNDSVITPGSLFLLTLVFGKWLIFINQNKIWQFTLFFLSLFFVCYGIKKIILTLQAIQEISINADDQSDQLKNALIQALEVTKGEEEPKPIVRFQEKSPFVLKPNTEAEINFEIILGIPGNNEAKNVDVWFLFSPEIEIIPSDKYSTPFKQNANYPIPNANTIRYKFDLVRRHTKSSGKIKIRATINGEFKLRYKADCDNHVEPVTSKKEIGIIVKE